jgi:PAS domain-containing protein
MARGARGAHPVQGNGARTALCRLAQPPPRRNDRWKNALVANAQKPLQLILARNLLTSISTPAFLLDEDSRLVFYNEAAGALLGISFEETGRMDPHEWTGNFGPFDTDGNPISIEQLDITHALSEGRPAHSRFVIRSAKGAEHGIEASAFPIIASEHGSSGAMIFFWPLSQNGDQA